MSYFIFWTLTKAAIIFDLKRGNHIFFFQKSGTKLHSNQWCARVPLSLSLRQGLTWLWLSLNSLHSRSGLSKNDSQLVHTFECPVLSGTLLVGLGGGALLEEVSVLFPVSSLFLPRACVQDVSSQLLLQCHGCLPAAMLSAWFSWAHPLPLQATKLKAFPYNLPWSWQLVKAVGK